MSKVLKHSQDYRYSSFMPLPACVPEHHACTDRLICSASKAGAVVQCKTGGLGRLVSFALRLQLQCFALNRLVRGVLKDRSNEWLK